MIRIPFPQKLLAVAVLAALPLLPAMAQSQPQTERGNRGQQDARSGLSESVRRVERDTRGEVISAERVPYDGREMHRVKVVDNEGRVRVFMQEPRRRDAAPTPRGGGNGQDRTRRAAPTRDDDD